MIRQFALYIPSIIHTSCYRRKENENRDSMKYQLKHIDNSVLGIVFACYFGLSQKGKKKAVPAN